LAAFGGSAFGGAVLGAAGVDRRKASPAIPTRAPAPASTLDLFDPSMMLPPKGMMSFRQ
jgi:hypothetical protein